MECGKEMNIDMSFDNIIKDQTDSKYKIIDYEWVSFISNSSEICNIPCGVCFLYQKWQCYERYHDNQ